MLWSFYVLVCCIVMFNENVVKRVAELKVWDGGVFSRVTGMLVLVHCMALVTQTHCRNCDCQQDRKYCKRTQMSPSDGANLLSPYTDIRSP